MVGIYLVINWLFRVPNNIIMEEKI